MFCATSTGAAPLPCWGFGRSLQGAMLTFRPDQFDTFQQMADDAFVESMVGFARKELAPWVQFDSDAILRERIKSGVARARSHGFQWQSSLAKFVTLMLRFCPNFDSDPAVDALLARTDLAPEARADLLFSDITAEQWAAIEERYEPAAWQEFATGPVL
ncbi:hypothetical protein BurJ1DRAFT_1088 [Burkholderiales bacterium JOSHI_001]|nr:hypothetical protein BurJ1DRAFT_1088 [Burkholderiales bacterium JOSHI_001]